jgi:hypothetical protein
VRSAGELSYDAVTSTDIRLDVQPRAVSDRALTRAEALAKLQSLSADPMGVDATSAGVVLVGLLPVPRTWAAMYQQQEESLLDPCTNVSIASAQLSEFEESCARQGDPTECALQRYADAAGAPLLVEAVHEAIAAHRIDMTDESMLRSNVFAGEDDAHRTWGADRIFVPAQTTPARPKVQSKTKAKGDP